jgi:hypothetical protein
MDCFVALLLAMTSLQFQTQIRIPAARCARVVHESFAQQRAWGMPGAQCTRGLAWEKIKPHEHSHHRSTRNIPAFPHAMVLTAYSVLSPAIGLSCHRHRRSYLRQLDAGVEASGPHVFAVRSMRRSSATPPRPPHPAPTSVTIAKRPSVWGGMANHSPDLAFGKTEIFLQMGLDRANQIDPTGEFRPVAHREAS